MNDDTHTIKSGLLNVGDGHKIYYQLWGNPDATTILVPHGGPGSNTKDKHKALFDPLIHRVIFFDQRGCGKSIAKDPFTQNTTQDTIADIEKLRVHLGVEIMHLFGYSWGSTLALHYAIQYPQRVNKLLLGGIYLASTEENKYLFSGGFKNFAPEAWDWYIQPVPKEKRDNCVEFYADMILSDKTPVKEKVELLRHYSVMESSMVRTDNDFGLSMIEANSIENLEDKTGALIGLQYFKNNCYIPAGYFQNNLHKLKDKQCVIVQGNMDFVCQPATAYRVAELMGDNCHLHFVPTSHAQEGAMRETLRAYAWSLLG